MGTSENAPRLGEFKKGEGVPAADSDRDNDRSTSAQLAEDTAGLGMPAAREAEFVELLRGESLSQ